MLRLVIRPKYVAERLERRAISGLRRKGGDRELNVDDRLRGEAGDRRRADVLDAHGDGAQRVADLRRGGVEPCRPGRVIRDNRDWHWVSDAHPCAVTDSHSNPYPSSTAVSRPQYVCR